VDWPHPLNSVSSLDLETGHGRRHVPKRMMAEWPRGRAPPREKEEEEEEVVEEELVREWKVGDVCECLDVVGAPLASLGRTELGGKLVPKKPGMYFKVRLDAVENVWPGFTSDDFPLVICKVTVASRRASPNSCSMLTLPWAACLLWSATWLFMVARV
jgi:hypothetical protein